MNKGTLNKLLSSFGYGIIKVKPGRDIQNIPDRELYTPRFSPWLGGGNFRQLYELAQLHTLVSRECCYILYTMAQQSLNLNGELWECGVYKGGTAMLLAEIISQNGNKRSLHLFDTFEGMPETDDIKDLHSQGDFSDTSFNKVKALVGREEFVSIHKGFIPQTFSDFEDSAISFAHIDVDIFSAVRDCCEFIYPRILAGGIMIFDDYGIPSCPGARQAIDEYFADKPEEPLILTTGQALVFKL